MTATPILSVIIPVYQTEPYLRECLASVARQTLDGIEVIVVNDGSPDDSQRIINGYEFVFDNFMSISIENQGQSVARNIGLERAQGKYVTFLDSDDLVPSSAYELLVGAAERTQSDISVGVAKTFSDRNAWINPQMRELYDCVGSHGNLDTMLPLVRDASPCNKVFLRDFLVRENLKFPAGISLREDLHFVLQAYVAANSVSVLPAIVYHYRARAKDAAASRTQEVNTKVFEDLLWVRNDLQECLSGKISKLVSRTIDSLFLEYIQYRLYSYLATQEHKEQTEICLRIQAFLQTISGQTIQNLSSAATRALLLLIREGKFDAARILARDKLEKRLRGTPERLASTTIEGLSDALRELADIESQSRGWRGLQKRVKRSQTRAFVRGREFIANAAIPTPRAQALPRIAKLSRARVNRRLRPKRDIWLVGERRGMSAEDTGVAFFRYLRKQHPEVDSYFVTKSDFVDSAEARELGNVLRYDSAKSYEVLLNASVLAYSDNGQDFFRKWGRVAKLLPKDTVGCFLQHGVIGLHAMGGLYSKAAMTKRRERLDLFVTSSPIEKKMVVKYLGFDDKEVIVTGLSRFDALSQSPSDSREILYMPSWREWLGAASQESYYRSEYFAAVQGFLSDHRLHRMLEEHDYTLVFAGHFAMQKRNSEFLVKSPRITFPDPTLVSLQTHVKRAGLLITDYSSVSFDFAYQKRPIIFYQFDAERFYRARGMMMLDPQTELLGRSIRTHAELLTQVGTFLNSDKRMEPKFLSRAEAFFPVTDTNNCERIYQEILDCRERKRRK